MKTKPIVSPRWWKITLALSILAMAVAIPRFAVGDEPDNPGEPANAPVVEVAVDAAPAPVLEDETGEFQEETTFSTSLDASDDPEEAADAMDAELVVEPGDEAADSDAIEDTSEDTSDSALTMADDDDSAEPMHFDQELGDLQDQVEMLQAMLAEIQQADGSAARQELLQENLNTLNNLVELINSSWAALSGKVLEDLSSEATMESDSAMNSQSDDLDITTDLGEDEDQSNDQEVR